MTVILDGKKLAKEITDGLALKVAELPSAPQLAVILAGTNPASEIYVNLKQKKAAELGMKSIVINLPEDISQDNLIEHIHILNEDKNINAILVQLPLPRHINTAEIMSVIDYQKDVDGFNPVNAGKMLEGQAPSVYPCTPSGVIRLLDEYKIGIEGKHAVVIGRSNIVGKPLAIMLLERNATVTTCHSRTKNLENHTRRADILISAIGNPGFIKAEMIKPGAVVIDVGISKTPEGKIVGDVDFENAKYIADAITPVPAGIGPMTIAMLMENTYKLYCLQNQISI